MIVLNDFDIIKNKTINSKSNNGLTDQFTAHLCYCSAQILKHGQRWRLGVRMRCIVY